MNRRGFTFIELVTVWAIIAVLMAILFPVFAKAQEKARQTNCLSNLGNIATALRIYAYDNAGHLPPTDNDLQPLAPRYLPEPAVLFCSTLRHKRPVDYPPPMPSEVAEGKTAPDYVYRGGLCDDDKPQELVAADLFVDLHNDGGNVLWVDGHAKWLSRSTFEAPGSPRGSMYGPSYPVEWSMIGVDAIQQLRSARAGRAYFGPPPPPRGADG
jgi:prepilin-type N-terminal cleavage/methylation domain-containing protein/prepilin-type processing-associated H-X9-DG protein